jgi:TolB-like protein
MPEDRVMTVAVTDFPDSIRNQTCGIGRFMAERLTTLLSQHRQCRLIERRRLDLVLSELKFSMSELVDPDKARKLGQMLGVQGLVVGSVTDLGGTVDVDARIIDIQTNVSLPGASTSIVQDEVTRRLIGDCGLAAPIPGPSVVSSQPGFTGPGGTTPASPRKSSPEATAGEITIALQSCRMSGTTITCSLSLTNNGENKEFHLHAHANEVSSRLFDQAGNEYIATMARLGNRESGWFAGNTLFKGIPTSAKLVFEKVSPDVTDITALVVGCFDGREDYSLPIRHVALVK